MVFGLLFSTMAFGWFAEVVNRPVELGSDNNPNQPKYWQMNNDNPHLLAIPELGARIHRLAPNLVGYVCAFLVVQLPSAFLLTCLCVCWQVPYCFVWGPILHIFFWNLAGAEQQPPAFVIAIIFSQFVLFSCFGATQFISLWREDGPSFFYWSEVSYQVLSLLATGVLGLTLMANVLIFDSFEESVMEAS